MTYYLVARKQQLVLQAGSSVDVRAHRWYMDDVYLGTKRPGERLFVHPRQGMHTIACLDDRGRLTSVQITVRYMMD
jgi:membrane carboxypeptidase/penicillin-binding protein PbpC